VSWELYDEDNLLTTLLSRRPELQADTQAWTVQFKADPYSLPHHFPADGPRSHGMLLGWWFAVRPFVFEVVLDDARFGTLTGIQEVPTSIWDMTRP